METWWKRSKTNMADLIRFVSKSDLDEKKAERREEREAVLRQVSSSFSVVCFQCFTLLT